MSTHTEQRISQVEQWHFEDDEELELFIPLDDEDEELSCEVLGHASEMMVSEILGLHGFGSIIEVVTNMSDVVDLAKRPIPRQAMVDAIMAFKRNPYRTPGNRKGVWVRFYAKARKPQCRLVQQVTHVQVPNPTPKAIPQVAAKPKPAFKSAFTLPQPSMKPKWARGW